MKQWDCGWQWHQLCIKQNHLYLAQDSTSFRLITQFFYRLDALLDTQWISWDAVWVLDSSAPREPCFRLGSRSPHVKVRFLGKGHAWASSGGSKEPCVTWGCTLAQPGKYSWTVRVWLPCNNAWTDQDAVCGVNLGVPKEPCIRWASRSPHAKGQFLGGKDIPGHAQRYSAVNCAKMAEPIKMSFWLWTRVGQRKHVLGGGAY